MQHFSYMPNLGILTAYAPTPCEIATFSAALADGLANGATTVNGMRIAEHEAADYGSPSSITETAELLAQNDVAVIQHEYGIYRGPRGDEVIQIMESLRIPTIVVAHAVLDEPTPQQHSVFERVVGLVDQGVVMSEIARTRLAEVYPVEQHEVVTIPHGADLPKSTAAMCPAFLTGGPIGPAAGDVVPHDAMASRAPELAPTVAWPVVADAYLAVARRLVAARTATTSRPG
jgi:hypothetical protein